MQFINSLNELENTPENYKFGVLVLSNDIKEEKTIIERSESFTDDSILYICPTVDKKYIKTKNYILNEINIRCKNTEINFNSCIILFKFKNNKPNFNSKRALNIPVILEYKVCLDASELILFINNKTKEMVNNISTSCIFKKYINSSIEVKLSFSLKGLELGIGVKTSTEKKIILDRMISK